MSSETLATIIVAIIMSVPGTFALYKQFKIEKAKAEVEEANAAEKIQTAALKMMDTYKVEFETLKCKITNLENRVKELERTLRKEMEEKKSIILGAWKLHDQVKQLNGTPEYIPPKHEEE